MDPKEQMESLRTALDEARTYHAEKPDQILLLTSDGRNGAFHVLDLHIDQHRQQLLNNPAITLRCAITPACSAKTVAPELLPPLLSEIDIAFSANGKCYNGKDLGDFIVAAENALNV